MTNEEILKKAIEKAVKGGFKGSFDYCGIYCEMACDESGGDCVYTTIFNHKFAKAFFKEGEFANDVQGYNHKDTWKYHLQQMVLEKEPLKYLKKFIK